MTVRHICPDRAVEVKYKLGYMINTLVPMLFIVIYYLYYI
jgi:hypothetical protein